MICPTQKTLVDIYALLSAASRMASRMMVSSCAQPPMHKLRASRVAVPLHSPVITSWLTCGAAEYACQLMDQQHGRTLIVPVMILTKVRINNIPATTLFSPAPQDTTSIGSTTSTAGRGESIHRDETRTIFERGICAIMALASCRNASSSVGSSSNPPSTLFCSQHGEHVIATPKINRNNLGRNGMQ